MSLIVIYNIIHIIIKEQEHFSELPGVLQKGKKQIITKHMRFC